MGIFKTGNQANHTYNMKFLIVACLFGLAVASNSYNDNHRRGYRVETRSYGHENRGYGNNGYGNRGYGGDSYGRQESYGSYGRDNRYGGDGGYNNDKSYGKVETREYHNDNRGYGYDNDKSYGKVETREYRSDNAGYKNNGYAGHSHGYRNDGQLRGFEAARVRSSGAYRYKY